MDPVSLIIGVSWILAGLLCIALAVPLAMRRVRRNSLYGMRFPQSYASEDAWLAINQYGGRRMLLVSPLLIAVGVVSLFLPLQTDFGFAIVIAFVPLIFILVAVFQTWRFARAYGKA